MWSLFAMFVAALGVLPIACSGKDSKPPLPESEDGARDRTDDAGPTPGPNPPVRSAFDEASPAQKKRYRRDLASGRRLAQARKWGEAIVEFAGAVEAIPGDGRALSELGWAAFQAGDWDRARTATRESVRVARDDKVRAASLYNLGRLAEAEGDGEQAAEHYRASLALRPHRTVEKRLRSLGGASPARPRTGMDEYRRCGPATVAEVCGCVLAKEGTPERAGSSAPVDSCHQEPRQVGGVELLFVGDDIEEWVHLIARSEAGWSAVARLGSVHDPDDAAMAEELEIARFEARQVGGRRILWLETVQTRTEDQPDRGVRESTEVRLLTLCLWSDTDRPAPGQHPLDCRLQVPLYDRYERRPLEAPRPGGDAGAGGTGTDRPAGTGDQPAPRRAGLVRTVRRVEVEVAEDGTVKVVLIEGDKTDALAPLLGEHSLW